MKLNKIDVLDDMTEDSKMSNKIYCVNSSSEELLHYLIWSSLNNFLICGRRGDFVVCQNDFSNTIILSETFYLLFGEFSCFRSVCSDYFVGCLFSNEVADFDISKDFFRSLIRKSYMQSKFLRRCSVKMRSDYITALVKNSILYSKFVKSEFGVSKCIFGLEVKENTELKMTKEKCNKKENFGDLSNHNIYTLENSELKRKMNKEKCNKKENFDDLSNHNIYTLEDSELKRKMNKEKCNKKESFDDLSNHKIYTLGNSELKMKLTKEKCNKKENFDDLSNHKIYTLENTELKMKLTKEKCNKKENFDDLNNHNIYTLEKLMKKGNFNNSSGLIMEKSEENVKVRNGDDSKNIESYVQPIVKKEYRSKSSNFAGLSTETIKYTSHIANAPKLSKSYYSNCIGLYKILLFCVFSLARHIHGSTPRHFPSRNARSLHAFGRHLPRSRLHSLPHSHTPHGGKIPHTGPEVMFGPHGHAAALAADAAAIDAASQRIDPVTASNLSLSQEEALAMGMAPAAAAAYAAAFQQPNSSFGDPNAYGQALSGEVVGGGVSGFNMGGANDPRAATSNVFHDPLEAALHEAGPFGSTSALSSNMLSTDDPTIQQRISESLDTVHDDTLKANLAKKQQLEAELEGRRKRALEDMNEMIKQNASAAAERDEMSAKMKAAAIAAKAPNGNLGATIPGTMKTYGQMVDEELAVADHASAHARNPDLYQLESAAAKTGLTRPTMGKEIQDQAIREQTRQALEEAAAARAAEQTAEEERRAANELAAKQLEAEKAMRDAERREAERRAVLETEAVQAAEANELYARAAAQARVADLQAGEEAAASVPSFGRIKKLETAEQLKENAKIQAGEAAVIQAAQQAGFEAKIIADQQRRSIAQDEAMVAAIGEKAVIGKELEKYALAMQDAAQSRGNAAAIRMGEAMAAAVDSKDISKAVSAASEAALAAVGEEAIAKSAVSRGAQLSQAMQIEAAEAAEARSRGQVMAVAAFGEDLVAREARDKGKVLAAAEESEVAAKAAFAAEVQKKAEAEAQQEAMKAKEAAMIESAAQAAAEEQAQAEAQKAASLEAEQAEAAIKAGFNTDDPYKILGTIPDDADTVAITNSSLQFPLKTFGPARAHNQAEAGALAAQNKVKDDIRGKVTAEKFDSPLNVIKGEGGYLNVPENAEKLKVESGRVYFPDSAIAKMEKEGIEVGKIGHKINTGERADMGIGLGYSVEDVSGMELDLPSPGNPDPPRVITGNGHTYDISQAQGMDIEKGELKLEKWNEYGRRVRPTVNTEIISNGRENIIEAVIDDDCIKRALKEAEAMFNSRSQIITNPSGESYIRVDPAFGVTQQLNYEDAARNLERAKESCRISNGQLGVSVMQEGDIKSAAVDKKMSKTKSLNIVEGSGEQASINEENELRISGLENATNQIETHNIIQKVNAFDKKIHGDKAGIIEEAAKNIEEETGMTAEEIKGEAGANEAHEEEMEAAMEEARNEITGGEDLKMIKNESSEGKAMQEEIEAAEKEIEQAGKIKQLLQKDAAEIAAEMGMSEEEYSSMVSKVSVRSFSSFINYSQHPSSEESRSNYEKSVNEIKLIFGNSYSSFEKIIFANVTKMYGYSDPEEHVIIKKETTNIPRIIKTETKVGKDGGKSTILTQRMVPVTRIIRIPIRKITHNGGNVVGSVSGSSSSSASGSFSSSSSASGSFSSSSSSQNSTAGGSLPAGLLISGKINGNARSNLGINLNGSKGSSSGFNTDSKTLQTIISGPGGLGSMGNKIKLGDNATVIGLEKEINDMIDLSSIGHITGEKNPPKNNILDKAATGPVSGTSKEVIMEPISKEECANKQDCVKKETANPSITSSKRTFSTTSNVANTTNKSIVKK